MKKILFCASSCVLLSTPASAQAVDRAVQDFGLIGLWAVDCNQDPAPKNEHATFSAASRSSILLVNDFGVAYDYMIYQIRAARNVGHDRLNIRQTLTTDEKISLDVVIWKNNDRIRTWSSRIIEGAALVRDGMVAAAGEQQTPWQVRCNERFAGNPGRLSKGR